MGTAVEDIKWLAQRLSGLLELAPKLESIEVLENQLIELRDAKTVALEGVKALQEELATARNKIADEKAQWKTEIAKYEAHATDLERDAKAEAVAILDKAKSDAAFVIAEAKKTAEAVKANSEVFENLVSAKGAELNDLQAKLAEAQKQLADIKSKL